MKKVPVAAFVAIIAALLTAGCRDTGRNSVSEEGIVTEADNLHIEDHEGYSLVTVRDGKNHDRVSAEYLLVDSGAVLPEGVMRQGITRVNVPLRRSLVYSNVHVSLLGELGAIDAVKGVCDGGYITDSVALHRLRAGDIRDCGDSRQPNMEAVMMLRPDAIMLAPYVQLANISKTSGLQIPVIEAADYLESSPLGRAEWIKFYGRLYGKGAQADSLFDIVRKEYNSLRDKTAKVKHKPTVLFDGVYNNGWNVPTSGSATGTLIKDAGGINPFASLNDAGSAQLAPEQVLYSASDADIWLVRYFRPDGPKPLAEWGAENKNYNRIKAFRNGNVFGSNTAVSGVFDDCAFHPQWILADMIAILHPEIEGVRCHKQYYFRMR